MDCFVASEINGTRSQKTKFISLSLGLRVNLQLGYFLFFHSNPGTYFCSALPFTYRVWPFRSMLLYVLSLSVKLVT